MSNNDLHSNIKPMMAVIPIALGATGVMAGAIIDRQAYGGLTFIIDYGSITTTGTNIAVLVKEGDVTGTLTSVNSFKYTSGKMTKYMFGPYLGSSAQKTYAAAATGPSANTAGLSAWGLCP